MRALRLFASLAAVVLSLTGCSLVLDTDPPDPILSTDLGGFEFDAGARDLGTRDLERVASTDDAGRRLLATAVDRLGLSARAYGKVLRVARTLADLDGGGALRAVHVAEAVHARLLDRVDATEAPLRAAAAG